jgi:ABC-type Mn2+/Zn2+ transport system ATPase subunit
VTAAHDHALDHAPSRKPSDRSPASPSVRLTGVSAGYGARIAISDADVEFRPGRLTAVFGPNGGGKSTLLKVVAGLLKPWMGSVDVLGAPPGVEARRVAYVPQAETVDWGFPVSAWDVVMMGRYPALGPLRRPGSHDRDAVAQALDQVGMGAHARTQIGSLSGGQRRRVFLARALGAAPELYLLDEPVTGVDITTQEDLLDILEAEAGRGKTVVATTHDLVCAAQRFQDVVAMNQTVIAQGPSSLVLDRDVLARTYGGHLLVLGEQAIMLDDAHHHDQVGGTERHYHDDAPGGHR